MVGGTKGSHTTLNGQVNVILIFGAGIKNRAFIIVKVIAEVIWTGNFLFTSCNLFQKPCGGGERVVMGGSLVKTNQLRFWVGLR